jgi:hypothetical protein
MRKLDDRHHPGGAKQLPYVIERPAQVFRGTQAAGCYDQVERMEIEALLKRGPLEIKRPELGKRILRESVLSICREPR